MSDNEYTPKNIEEKLKLDDAQRQYQTRAYRDVVTKYLAWGVVIAFVASLSGHYVAIAVLCVSRKYGCR